jgi:hypothetical protein
MNKKIIMFVLFIVINAIIVAAAGDSEARRPNFGPALYADGEVWGTKGTTNLPAPNEHNRQSFDVLYVITNSNNPADQLPVGEAAPGNPDYNGGRWFTHTVEWTAEGFMAHGIVPLLTSYDEIMEHRLLGHLVITPGSFPGGPPVYFQCPLLPVLE